MFRSTLKTEIDSMYRKRSVRMRVLQFGTVRLIFASISQALSVAALGARRWSNAD